MAGITNYIIPNRLVLLNAPTTVDQFMSIGATAGEVGQMSPASAFGLIAPSGVALTRTNDTNVTLTLGGSPTTALLNATSMTLGWSGQLAVGRGGSGVGTLTGLLQGNGTSAFTAITNSSTVGQTLRVTGASTYAWGALDLANTSAVTGNLPIGNIVTATNRDSTHFLRGDGAWITPTTVASAMKFNFLTDASGTNTVDNTTFTQTWGWSGAYQGGILMTAASTTAQNSSYLLALSMSGAYSGASQDSVTFDISNSKSGATSTNHGIRLNVQGATTNKALLIQRGFVELGTVGTETGLIKLNGATSGTVSIRPQAVAGTWTFQFPQDDGNSNEVLITDGSGITDWVNISTLITPLTIGTTTITSGTDTRVLFQDGSVVGQDAEFTYDKTADKLTVSGTTFGKYGGAKGVETTGNDLYFVTSINQNLFFLSGTQGFQVDPNGGTTTKTIFKYGGNSGYLEVGTSFMDIYPSASVALRLGSNNTTGYFQINTSGLIQFHGITSSFPALKRSSAILQVRLADDSAYTDLEVADEAYDATNWNGSLEVPTKNAIRDKIESMSSGSGITRSIVNTSGSATMGSSASTDYVYIVTGAHTMSLPAAASNTNRYTVKNTHVAAITVDTAGAENIEGAASYSLAVGTAIDIISDNTNWWIV